MSVSNSKTDEDLLFEILPMIQRIVLNCWDNEHFPYTKSQMILFSILLKRESATMKEVASLLSCSKEQATRVVAPLVDSGLVDRYVDSVNRNYIHVRLTESGKAYISEQRNTFHRNLSNLLSESLNEQERQNLYDSVKTAVQLLEKIK